MTVHGLLPPWQVNKAWVSEGLSSPESRRTEPRPVIGSEQGMSEQETGRRTVRGGRTGDEFNSWGGEEV